MFHTTTFTPYRLFTNDTGRTWAVRILPVGARYGRHNKLLVDDDAQVEFYDTSYADDGTPHDDGFGPLGQFASRYAVATLLGADDYGSGQGGLVMDTNVAEWRLDADTMEQVRAWLREQYVPRVVLRPYSLGPDYWVSDEGTELIMTCKYIPGRPTRFTILWLGRDAEGRRKHGGPGLRGPYGSLIAQATVIAAHPLPQPSRVKVAAGQELDLVLIGDDSETEFTAPVTRVRITDDNRLDYPHLVVCE